MVRHVKRLNGSTTGEPAFAVAARGFGGFAGARRAVVVAALVAGLLLMPVGAAAAERVGRVLVAVGGVTAEQDDASARGLGRRDPIYAGDRIRTGARGRAQIRFEDGAMVDLEPGSTFEVEEYTSPDEDGGGSVIMNFVRGAMRTVTGAIGGGSGGSYRMNTSVATLGVRGTAYSLRYCDATCAGEGGEAGLYGRVDDGAVTVDGAGGMGTFGAGQFFFVPEAGSPRRIVAPPEGILDGGEEDGEEGGDEERIEDVQVRPLESGGDNGAPGSGDGDGDDLLDPRFEQGDNEDLEARPGTSTKAAFSGAFVGSSGFAVYESPGGGDVRRDGGGRIVGAEFDGYGFVDATDLDHVGGVTAVSDPITEEQLFDVSWGSWSAESGTVRDGDIAGFTYAVTDPGNFTTATELQNLKSGGPEGGSLTLTYSDRGGPPAIDTAGGAWDVIALHVGVDFSTGLTDATISLEPEAGGDFISVNKWADAGDTIGSINADGTFSVDGLSTPEYIEGFEAEGALAGRFLGRNAEGALVAFEVREVDGDRRIVGTQVLGATMGE